MTRDEWIEMRLRAVRACIPAAYQDLELTDDEVRDWCDRVATGTHGSLLLVGPKGTGKTFRGWACWPHLIGLGWIGTFHATTEVAYLDATFRREPDKANSCDLLLLDDLGGGPVSDWSRSRLLHLIDRRWLAGRPLIATTNLTAPQLTQHLGDRAASRLAHQATTVTLTGADRRLA